MIGQTISHYEVQEKLGEGGMGVVYKAFDSHLGRLVAVKVLPRDKVADVERKRRFIQEAKAASALNHPNIVTIYDIDSALGIDFIAMELVSGKTLDRLIPRHGLQLNEALNYSVQIAAALASAHKIGIVHRDLKPGNVMINEQGLVKVLDFGLAKLTEPVAVGEDEVTHSLKPTTEEGKIVGTISYMSPEQAEGKKLDARSDMFSFGALLYEMVTGRRAFQGDSKLSTLTAILREEPAAASQVAKGLPRELERVIARCLRKSPEKRFQSMPDLKVALEELKEESDSGTLGAVPSPTRPYRALWACMGALVLIGLVVALSFIRSAHKTPESPLTAVPFVTYPGYQGIPTFSPDGNQVAFSWNGEKVDNFDIYVKLIGTAGPPLRLTSNPAGDYSPAWSPDGRFIAFVRDLSREKSAVLVIPALGGPERKVAEIFNPRVPEMPIPNVAWSPDGKWLAFPDRDSPTAPYGLVLLSVETTEKRKVTFPPAQVLGDSGPAFSPDGRALAFSRWSDYGIGDIYVMDFANPPEGPKGTGEARRVTFENSGASSPAWTADGREIVFTDGAGIWRTDTTSRGPDAKPQQITSLGGNVDGLAVSPRGKRLAYVHYLYQSNIWRIPAPSLVGRASSSNGKSRETLGAASFIASTRTDSAPQYSQDGKRITFQSDRSGFPEIWSCDSDGSNPQQLTSFGGPLTSTPRWSPDGTRIAFDSNAGGQYDIWVVDANGGKPRRMTNHPANDGNPSWSRDGRWIYFDSARTGQAQVWKLPANGGEPVQVTWDGGFAPVESPDGRFIYYLKGLMKTDVWRIPLDGSQPTKVLEGVSEYRNLAVLESGLLYVPTRKTSSLQFLSFASGKIAPIANFERPISQFETFAGLGVSPDRRWILYTQFQQAGHELMLV